MLLHLIYARPRLARWLAARLGLESALELFTDDDSDLL